MDEIVSAAAVCAFLRIFLEDRRVGRDRTLCEYQALFPGHQNAIAGKLAELEAESLRERDGTTAWAAGATPSRLGRFRILEEIGHGGQGVVYLARDEQLGRNVAVKALSARFALDHDALERFQREAHAASRLDHPGICKVHEFGSIDGRPYFVMPYVPGEDLARRLASTERAPATEMEVHAVLALFEGAAHAVHVAHENGIVHRDLKPGNLLVTDDGHPVLLDFGLAHDESSSVSLTLSGDVFGTPAYMAPEQLDARGTDARTDVYALGVTLYECLTLQPPFERPTRDALYRAILTEEPDDPRELNPALSRDVAAIVATALAKEPENRYPTAAELADDLRRVRDREPVRARRAGPVLRLRRWIRRDPALAGTLVGLVATLTLGLAVTGGLAGAAARSRQRVEELADRRATGRLLRSAETDLLLALPERLPALNAWLAETDGLLGRDHVPADEAEELRAARIGVRSRRDDVASLARRSIDDHRPAWEATVDAVASQPAYAGLSLTPQIGLVPLGTDPDSGLFEFAHLQTGTIPARDDAGRLEVSGATGIVFVLIPPGPFVMGQNRPIGNYDTEPEHEVVLDAFFLSKYETTQAQWLRVTGTNPSLHAAGEEKATPILPTHPVENVSWNDCHAFAARFGLVLPTEAQWEYAARAGTRMAYGRGPDPRDLLGYANVADLSRERLGHTNDGAAEWPGHDDGYPYHSPVGTFRANPFGLHDVLGNVREYVRDFLGGTYDDPVQTGDGLRLVEESGRRFTRGGTYHDTAVNLTLHRRYGDTAADTTYSDQGFRPARALWTPAGALP